jgi:nitronate monooxygenase
MAGFAGAPLATAVSQAGGIGLVGVADDVAALEANLSSAHSFFTSPSSCTNLSAKTFLAETKTLPIGVGFLPFFINLETALPVLQKNPPALVWLFAAREFEDYATWATALRKALPDTKIWIQVGSASAALEIAKLAAPDVLVLQGADAGGHGFARSAGIISLLPETRDLLASHSLESPKLAQISLVATGGIADGRGVASALALGAEGVVMGTGFLGASETKLPHPSYRSLILDARDGGLSTARSAVYDQLRGPNIWPELYDGRALATASFADWSRGEDIGTIRERYQEAAKREDRGYTERAAVWAGTGVGLVNEVKTAREIVEGTREGAKRALSEALESI